MIQIEFTENEKKVLHYERFHNPHPRVQQRMEVLWFKSQGMKHEDITKYACLAPNTVTSYLKMYKEGGIEKLKEVRFYRPISRMLEFIGTIKSYFEKNPPATIKEAATKIKKITGIERRETQVRQFLKSLGMKCRKVGSIPAKADVDKQKEFKKKTWILE